MTRQPRPVRECADRPRRETVHVRRLTDILRSPALDGYRNGPPPGADPHYVELDRLAVETGTCRTCGAGMDYRQFFSPSTGSHRAFAVCAGDEQHAGEV